MPYVVAGSCPECGAPIFVYVKTVVDSSGMVVATEDYPPISYNCGCFKEKREGKDES